MKIRCIILRRNRTIILKPIDGNNSFFRFSKGIYLTPKNFVNLVSQIDKTPSVRQHPELIYFEDDPVPLKIILNKDKKESQKELDKRSGKFLDKVVIGNALKELAKPQGIGFQILMEYIKSPQKMIPMLFMIIIVCSLIYHFIFSGGAIFG
ncbi:hypothetical protein ES702_03908 [subsurface metagenome]